MGAVLRNNVHVTLPDNSVTILPRGSAVPKELAKYVTNPKAYVEADAEQAEGESSEQSGGAPYADLDYQALKAELKRRELPQSGKEAELRARLVEADAEQAEGESSEQSGGTSDEQNQEGSEESSEDEKE